MSCTGAGDAQRVERDQASFGLGLQSVKGATFQKFHTKIIFTFDVSVLITKYAPYNSFA